LGWAHERVAVLVWTDREDGPRLISCRKAESPAERPNPMSKKRTSKRTRQADVPYNAKDRAGVLKYWQGATRHRGVAELRAKRGRPALTPEERKEQVALRIDRDVIAWYRAQGAGWQTRMNAVLKAFKDARR